MCLMLATWAPPALAANDYFLKIGDIEGESTSKGFEKQIVVSSWSWGLTNNAGTPSFQDLGWTQGVDKSIVPMVLGVANNTEYDKATLSVVSASAAPTLIFEMVFHKAHLTSLSAFGSGTESVQASLRYNQVDMRYRPLDAKGGSGPWVSGSFTMPKGQAAAFSGDPDVIQGLFLSGGSVNLAAIPAIPEPQTWAMLLLGLGCVARLAGKARARRAAR